MLPLRHLERGTITRIGDVPRLLIDIVIGPATSHNFWTGLAHSLATGGVFLATHHVMKIDGIVELHVTLPGETLPVLTLARVRLAIPHGEDVAGGWVLSFVDIDARALAPIRRFVADVRAPLFFDVD